MKHSAAENENGRGIYAEFPEAEFEQRYRRLRIEMAREGLVALLATNEANFRYLTGTRNQRWPNSLRPHAALLPLDGEPAIIQGATDNWGLHQVTWIRDLRGFGGMRVRDGYGRHLVESIVATLADRKITNGKVGIEGGWNMYAGLSIEDYQDLKRRLAPVELVDASHLWWNVRMYKSPLEIDCLRRSAQITSAAYADLPNEIAIGMTELEIEQRFCALLMKHGAERPTYNPVNCHAGRWPPHQHIVLGLSTANTLKNNSVVDMDGGCTFKGYWSDFSRVFGFGKPPEKAISAYRVAQQAIDAAMDAIRPGYPISDVYRAMAKAFAAANKTLQVSEKGMSESGINGHGLGLSATERPYVNLEDSTVMTPGLFFTLEPIFAVDGYGMMLGEEMVVVTETGHELLSRRAAPELPIVG